MMDILGVHVEHTFFHVRQSFSNVEPMGTDAGQTGFSAPKMLDRLFAMMDESERISAIWIKCWPIGTSWRTPVKKSGYRTFPVVPDPPSRPSGRMAESDDRPRLPGFPEENFSKTQGWTHRPLPISPLNIHKKWPPGPARL